MYRSGLFAVTLTLFVSEGRAQLIIDGSLTPEQLVTDFFQGPGVTIQNIQYQHMPGDSIVPELGAFYAESVPGLPFEGIVLTTGALADIVQPSDSFASSEHLQGIDSSNDISWVIHGFGSTQGVPDFCVLEFDFIPDEGNLEFTYAFASEEYPEYACDFTDGFGFFLSGPGISGAFPYTDNADNLAVLPGTLLSVNVFNINGGDPDDPINCPPNNEDYYVDNTGSPWLVFDGMTTLFTVGAVVTPGEQYHMRLEVADAGDPFWDSALFFQVNSFRAFGGTTSVRDMGDACSLRYAGDGIVQLCGIKDNCTMRVLHSDGREAVRRAIASGDQQVQLPALSSGIYLLELAGDADRACMRFVIP